MIISPASTKVYEWHACNVCIDNFVIIGVGCKRGTINSCNNGTASTTHPPKPFVHQKKLSGITNTVDTFETFCERKNCMTEGLLKIMDTLAMISLPAREILSENLFPALKFELHSTNVVADDVKNWLKHSLC